MINPRQADSMTMSMSGMSMSMSMTTSGMGTSSTMSSMGSNSSATGIALSPAVIAILAVIGGIVVFIFIGFWIHARVKEHRLRNNPRPSHQITSGSLSGSTVVGPPKGNGSVVNGSYSRIDQTGAPPNTVDYDQKKPPVTVSSIPTDAEMRLQPQRMPPKDTATELEAGIAPPIPHFAGHPYMQAYKPPQDSINMSATSLRANLENNNTMQQTNFSTPIINPHPVNPTPRSLPKIQPLLPPGITKVDDNTSQGEHDAASPTSSRRDRTMSPRPLPRIPQSAARTASLSSKTMISDKKGDQSFLTFDETRRNTRVDGDVPVTVERPPERSLRTVPSSGIRVMAVAMEYEPELPDELELKVGESVRMLREFDDGWCIVEHIHRTVKRSGAVPRMCLEERSSG